MSGKPKKKRAAEAVHADREGARLLLTIPYDAVAAPFESDIGQNAPSGAELRSRMRGAIVRIDPSPGVSADMVAEFRDELLALGAIAVKSTPTRRSTTAGEKPEAEPLASLITLRQAVERAVDEALVDDREALAAACEDKCAKVGL